MQSTTHSPPHNPIWQRHSPRRQLGAKIRMRTMPHRLRQLIDVAPLHDVVDLDEAGFHRYTSPTRKRRKSRSRRGHVQNPRLRVGLVFVPLETLDTPPRPELDTAFRTPRFGPLGSQPKVRKRFAAPEAIQQPFSRYRPRPPLPGGLFII